MSGGHFPLYRSEIKSDSINSDVGIPQNINSPYFPGKSHNLKIKHRTANVLRYRCHISFNGIKAFHEKKSCTELHSSCANIGSKSKELVAW